MKQILADNLKKVRDRIDRSCHRARRVPSEVKLVAVTKYAPPEVIRLLLELGQADIGESRVQELVHRAEIGQQWLSGPQGVPRQTPPPRWHMVGHLQRNKVRALLPWVSLIHSVDSLRLAEELDAESARLGRNTDILLEVNASGEASKEGVAVAAATHLAEQICTLSHLNLRGLMAMGPLTQDTNSIRHAFERVRELFDEIISERVCGPGFRELSLGMSSDFELGIEFGATYVRIGSALFEGLNLPRQEPVSDYEPTIP